MSEASVTVVIPTYGREQVLTDTIRHVFNLTPAPVEIIVLDQTERHTVDIAETLEGWHVSGLIRWIRLPEPLIPRAMNRGLMEAKGDIILFLDDDVIPERELIKAHAEGHKKGNTSLIAGRVVQPWQEGIDFSREDTFHFASCRSCWVNGFMAGNFSIRRDMALKIGGFDEQFVRVAYNFEAEFAYRWLNAGHRILFEPSAAIHHLKMASGGTRTFGEHLRSFHPNHSVGAYYYFLRTWSGRKSLALFVLRPLRAICTRHHLRRPWWILATVIAEVMGMAWALTLAAKGPRYINSDSGEQLNRILS